MAIWGRRGPQSHVPAHCSGLGVQGGQWVKSGSSGSPILSQAKSRGWWWGWGSWLKAFNTAPQEETTVPTGPEVPDLCFKSCSGRIVARMENQSVSPDRLEKTHLFIVCVTNSIAFTLGNLHFQGERFIFNYCIRHRRPLQT